MLVCRSLRGNMRGSVASDSRGPAPEQGGRAEAFRGAAGTSNTGTTVPLPQLHHFTQPQPGPLSPTATPSRAPSPRFPSCKPPIRPPAPHPKHLPAPQGGRRARVLPRGHTGLDGLHGAGSRDRQRSHEGKPQGKARRRPSGLQNSAGMPAGHVLARAAAVAYPGRCGAGPRSRAWAWV